MIVCPEMCKKHQSLLIHQANYSKSDSWQILIVATQVALFQKASCDTTTHKKLDGDINKISTLGCLACYSPDAFGEIVEVAKSHDLKKIKELGEKYVKEASSV